MAIGAARYAYRQGKDLLGSQQSRQGDSRCNDVAECLGVRAGAVRAEHGAVAVDAGSGADAQRPSGAIRADANGPACEARQAKGANAGGADAQADVEGARGARRCLHRRGRCVPCRPRRRAGGR